MTAPPEDKERSERERTDKSLATERQKTDDELAKRGAALEQSSDHVVARARHRADQVLDHARRSADEKLRSDDAARAQQADTAEQRLREDRAIRDEYATADQTLASERDAHRRALAALLALERDDTDHHLLLERKRADVAVASRDEFLAIVSHDVRNLLGGMVMSASSLVEIPCDDGTKAAITREGERIRRYAARMNRLVGDLIDLASIEAGRLAIIPRREDATELLRESVDAFQPIASAKQISLRTEVRAGTVLARYDHERILQVLANLVGNAIKFTPDGGRIDLVVEAVDRDIRFAVRDTGPGIPSDRLAVVFDRYWQRVRDRHAGLGLGLYIARCIVEAHGGRIWAESTSNAGSTFYFTLPAAPGRVAGTG